MMEGQNSWLSVSWQSVTTQGGKGAFAAATAAAADDDNFACRIYCPCSNVCSHTDVYIISID